MNGKSKTLFMLLTLSLSVFALAGIMLSPRVNATYVEGDITQDTVWTLVQSPFIVSKDVSVLANSTLTIEPGVEVRFGANLSLFVMGRLMANGTEKTITFTSNREQPSVADWGMINFAGAARSYLINCYLAYAKDGILVEDGDVQIENSMITQSMNGVTATNSRLSIENSVVSLCSQNGINTTDSQTSILNCEISENLQNGIWATGIGQVTIGNNTLIANGNGIVLTGTMIANVDIQDNLISSSVWNGLQIEVETLTNITIVDNNVVSNDVGFYISSQMSTSISGNSISYNRVGFLYGGGDHFAHFNDIYGNTEMGMDVVSNATVNAEQNYWGSASGPRHESINPNGQGDRVGGDGNNLDFIFFLVNPIGHINVRPAATLLSDKAWTAPNEVVTFFGTNSYDTDGQVERYFFDFGDGSTSGWITLSIPIHRYASVGTYTASLAVMDDFGAVSIAAIMAVHVDNLPPLHVSIDLNASALNEGYQVPITVHVTDGVSPVANTSLQLISVTGGSFTPSSETSAGNFETVFNAPYVPQMNNIRIVATASMNGSTYVDGSDYKYVEVLPSLSVQLTADKTSVLSGEITRVVAHVESNGQAVAGASVIASSLGGILSPETATSDSNGDAVFNFTATDVDAETTVAVTARAALAGYAGAQAQLDMTISPRVFSVQITVPTLHSGEPVVVVVHVTDQVDLNDVNEANVTVSCSQGNFVENSKITGITGTVPFTFNTPQTSGQMYVTIWVNVTKNGYTSWQSQTAVAVTPAAGGGEGGFPWLLLLLIMIPIVIVVVVVVLIKLKVIAVSVEEPVD